MPVCVQWRKGRGENNKVEKNYMDKSGCSGTKLYLSHGECFLAWAFCSEAAPHGYLETEADHLFHWLAAHTVGIWCASGTSPIIHTERSVIDWYQSPLNLQQNNLPYLHEIDLLSALSSPFLGFSSAVANARAPLLATSQKKHRVCTH